MPEVDILGPNTELSGSINYLAVFIGIMFGFVSALVMVILYSRVTNKKVTTAVMDNTSVGYSTKAGEVNSKSARFLDVASEDDGQSISAEQIDLHVSTGSVRDLRSRFATRHNSGLSQSSKSQRATIDISHEHPDDSYADASSPTEPHDAGAQSAKSYFRRISVGRSASKYSHRSPTRRHAPAGLDTYEGARAVSSNVQGVRSDDVHEFNSDDEKELGEPTDVFDPGFFNYSTGGDGVDSPLHASSNSTHSTSFGLRSRSAKAVLAGSALTNSKSKSKSNIQL